MKKSILIHVGAHKTATTYLQNTLKNNKDRLLEKRLLYVPLKEMRSNITNIINDKKYSAEETYNAINSYTQDIDFDTLLLSDENISGGIDDIFKHQEIALKLKYRVKKLNEAFKDSEVKIFLTIRSYEAYYASLYCEFLRHFKKYVSFERFMEDFDYLHFNWTDVVRDLLVEMNASNLCVFTFEDFIAHQEMVFRDITNGLMPDDYQRQERDHTRASFNHATVDILEALSNDYNVHFVKKLLESTDAIIASSDYAGKFRPFDASQTKYLKEKYMQDLSEIKRLGVKTIDFHPEKTA